MNPRFLPKLCVVPTARNGRRQWKERSNLLKTLAHGEPVEKALVPKHHRTLRGKWIYKIKRDGSYKARWVVKGFEQVKGIDYQQVFAAVVRADTFRTLLAIATLLDWDISTVDVDSAFLYGEIDNEVFIDLPEGFRPSNKCGKLRKSLYGLKQAPPI